jgi:serine protease AprX
LLNTHAVSRSITRKANQIVALALAFLLGVSPLMAGIRITASDGIFVTSTNGIVMSGTDGIIMTGADGFLTSTPNGIVMTGADGIAPTGANGLNFPNSLQMTRADGIVMTGADGIVMTGADGIVMTGADGTTYTVDSVTASIPNGIVMTGADGIVMTGADGIVMTGADGIVMTGADGIVMTGADGIVMTGADTLSAIGADGVGFSIVPDGVRFAGVTGIVMTGADGIVVSGATGIIMTGADGIITAANRVLTGLQSVDPELAVRLNQLTDDSGVNAVVVYHSLPTNADLADLRAIGILGGTRFRALPMISITATRNQIIAISHLPAVRSIYGNRTLSFASEPEVRAVTGVERARLDTEITTHNGSLPVTGRNVTVAVLDTGIDGSQADLANRIVQNIKLLDTQGIGVGFNYPLNSGNLPNTDLLMGHGTFVAGLIAGNGSRSSGRYAGVAPDARLVGLSAGDLTLLFVLNGLDYLLANREALGVRVLNCSFSANTVYDTNDPVNVATRLLTQAGVNVVFSAGNNGPGLRTLNPYAVAPWVVSVGSTDTQGKLASFSSRGDFASSLFHPTLVAPGVDVVSLRASGINLTGALGLIGADTHRLSAQEIPFYTTANGTSFSAPQVAGTIALMLEANPNLTTDQVRDILQRTATPLTPYYQHETGAGLLNVHAAVLEATFPDRHIGSWRGTLDRGQVRLLNDPAVQFSGTVLPGAIASTSLTIPDGALTASVQIAWGPMLSINDLALSVYDPAGSLRAQSNVINLPVLNGKRERVLINLPAAGTWRAAVRRNLVLSFTAQPYVGALEVGRAQYSVTDLATMNATLRNEVQQSLRTYAICPIGNRFRPDFFVSRSDLAMSLVVAARVPQYLPGQQTYRDVAGNFLRLFVESVQASPNGAMFVDVTPGGQFRPNDVATRLTAAVALVRAAGLRSEAEARAGVSLPILDGESIPSELRGYVSVAISEGLLPATSLFRPQAGMTRAELAHAITLIENRAIQ